MGVLFKIDINIRTYLIWVLLQKTFQRLGTSLFCYNKYNAIRVQNYVAGKMKM